MYTYRCFVLLRTCLLVSARVWVEQNSIQQYYKEGDTAVINCNVLSNEEKTVDCLFMWYIWNLNIPNMSVNIENDERYQRRVTLDSNETFATLTVKGLSLNDTDMLKCIAECFVDDDLDRYFGKGNILIIQEKNERPGNVPHFWLRYLILCLNLIIFLIISVICFSVIRTIKKTNKNKSTRDF